MWKIECSKNVEWPRCTCVSINPLSKPKRTRIGRRRGRRWRCRWRSSVPNTRLTCLYNIYISLVIRFVFGQTKNDTIMTGGRSKQTNNFFFRFSVLFSFLLSSSSIAFNILTFTSAPVRAPIDLPRWFLVSFLFFMKSQMPKWLTIGLGFRFLIFRMVIRFVSLLFSAMLSGSVCLAAEHREDGIEKFLPSLRCKSKWHRWTYASQTRLID